MITAGSVCTGTGALDWAASAVLGARTAWMADIDPDVARLIACRYPGVPNLGDLTSLDWRTVDPVRLLLGGFPCQDISPAGLGAGIAPGTRSGLWSHIAWGILTLSPDYVFIENSGGLTSARAHSDVEFCPGCMGNDEQQLALRAFGRVLGDLAELGFDAQWCVVPASAVGCCQQRKRAFIWAWRRGCDPVPAARADEGTGRGWADLTVGGPDQRAAAGGDRPVAAPGAASERQLRGADRAGARRDEAERGEAVAQPPGDGGAAADPDHDAGREPHQLENGRLGGSSGDDAGRRGGAAARPGRLRGAAGREPAPGETTARGGSSCEPGRRGGERGAAVPEGIGWGERRYAREQRGPDAALGGGGGGARDWIWRIDAGDRIFDYTDAVYRWEDLTRTCPPPVVPNRAGNLRLNPELPEWMMGYPAGWVTAVPGLTRTAQLRIIGNGVVPGQAAYALELMLTAASQREPRRLAGAAGAC